MNTLQEGFNKINEAFNEDFIEQYKALLQLSIETIQDKFCICGEHRNEHSNGEGGSPSPCEDENCYCADYQFSMIRSLLHDRDEFIKYDNVKKYPLLPLIIVLQASGFDSDYLQFFNDYYLWNGDPATKPLRKDTNG